MWNSKCIYWEDATTFFFTSNDPVVIFAVIETIIEEIIENKVIVSVESFLDDLSLDELVDFLNLSKKK